VSQLEIETRFAESAVVGVVGAAEASLMAWEANSDLGDIVFGCLGVEVG
jgi:hypothetical protein